MLKMDTKIDIKKLVLVSLSLESRSFFLSKKESRHFLCLHLVYLKVICGSGWS